MNGFTKVLLTLSALTVLAAPIQAATATRPAGVPEDFTGVLLSRTGVATVPITLHVDAVTSAGEVRRLSRVLGDKGPSGVAAALAVMRPSGWIRVGDLIGFEVPVIREFTTARGSRIYAVLDRPFPLLERLGQKGDADAPFGMIELKLGLDGSGSGILVPAGRAMFTDDGKVEIVSNGAKPDRIIGVTQQPFG